MRRIVVAALLGLVATLVAPVASPAEHGSVRHYVGGLHTHTGYSDGQPGSTPADAYARARDAEGLDFLAVTEHSEALAVPMTLSEGCLPTSGGALVECALADADPLNAADKWDAQRRQAAFASRAEAPGSDGFLGLRGFEWTSDTYGHVNVYFSRNYATRVEGGEATLEGFYRWLQTPAAAGGGADGLATFNHPGDKDLDGADPRRNWNGFAYVPALDDRIVGIEIFNRTRARYEDEVVQALDAGWHLGFVGAEDIHETNWGAREYAKTVFLAGSLTPAAFEDAMAARRVYATLDPDVRIELRADGRPMGSRIGGVPGSAVPIHATVDGGDVARLELVSNAGEVVASAEGREITYPASVEEAERYYFLRVVSSTGDAVAYASPVWVAPAPVVDVCIQPVPPVCEADATGFTPGWVSGDLHVHTTWSHDSYGGPHDHNTGADEFYVAGWAPGEQLRIAESRDLDYLAITDHNNTLSVFDPGTSSDTVTPIPAYEKSLSGHVQMLGATSCYTPSGRTAVVDECPRSFNSPAQVRALADAIRADGGVFQVNHPSDGDWLETFGDGGADDPVVPDSVEVWNIGPWHWQPPMPSANDNDFSLRFWESYLNAGYKVAATGGSDNHWRSTTAAQGAGQPTTWVYVTEPGVRGVLDGIRAGRTTISHQPPGLGGPMLTVDVDADGDGVFESMIGDEVPGGAPMRIRTSGLAPGGFYRVVTSAGAEPIVLPATPEHLLAVPDADWFYVELRYPDGDEARTAGCDPVVGGGTTYCRNRLFVAALTSALFVVP